MKNAESSPPSEGPAAAPEAAAPEAAAPEAAAPEASDPGPAPAASDPGRGPASAGEASPALRASFVGNLALALGKTAAGWSSGSQALVADGLHSFSDVAATVISWVGAAVGAAPPDDDHPHGHGAAENLAALAVALLMLWAAYELFEAAVQAMLAGGRGPPGVLALWAAAAGCVVKELLHRQARAEWHETGSPAILALARDHRSDVLGTLAALAGAAGARAGIPLADPAAAIVIGGFILRLAWETGVENLHVLLDREPEIDDLVAALRQRASDHPETLRIRDVRAHQAGRHLSLEIDLGVEPTLTVARAHVLAHEVEDWAKQIDERVHLAQVHVEPLEG